MSVRHFHFAALVMVIAFLCFQTVGCGPEGSSIPEAPPPEPDPSEQVPGYITISLSQTTVRSDNSDFSIITARVLDESRAVIPDITVEFSANAGQFSQAFVLTDANGEAQTSFSAGTLDPSNQVATISATVSGLNPAQIPIQIVGSSLTATTDKTSLTDDGSEPATLTIAALSASDVGLNDIPIELSVSGTGSASLSPASGITDVNGELEVTVSGTGAGNITVTAQGLGATVTQDYSVSPVSSTLRIISPVADPYSLPTNTDLTITVSAPIQNTVRFATTLGQLTGSSGVGQVLEEPVVNLDGTVSVSLRSSLAGMATVQVFDADLAAPPPADTLTVAISAPSSEATQVALQVSPSVVAPSVGGIQYKATLTVTVKNASDQVVRSAPVQLTIETPTGGGETIKPVIVYTDDQGTATATFTSGSLSTDADGVEIKARVLTNPFPEDTQSIVIGGTAASVIVGQGTTIRSKYNDTVYELPMSVMVSDSNGNPVSGAVVSLNAWPGEYAVGYWVEVEDGICQPIGPATIDSDTGEYISGREEYPNEDVNQNLILDPAEDLNMDGQLTPPNTSVGSLPGTVVTDEYGVAQFNLQYSKGFAGWIRAEITASTTVYGTETRSTSRFWLRWLVDDSCFLPNSPFD